MYRSWVNRRCIQGLGVRTYQSCSETGVYGYRQKVKTEYQGMQKWRFIFLLKNRHGKCVCVIRNVMCTALLPCTIRWNCCSRLKNSFRYGVMIYTEVKSDIIWYFCQQDIPTYLQVKHINIVIALLYAAARRSTKHNTAENRSQFYRIHITFDFTIVSFFL